MSVGHALGAAHRAVGIDTGLARVASASGKLLDDVATGTEVHLVRSLAGESGMRHHGVVLLHVVADETLDRGKGIELVEVHPVVLERSPERLDHGVGEGNFDLSQNALERTDAEQLVHLLVDVLEARVSDEGGLAAGAGNPLGSVEKDRAGVLRVETLGELPSENAPGEVVNHRVQVHARAVEQLDESDVDMPVLVGVARPHALARSFWMHPQARSSPAVLADLLEPGPSQGKYAADALSMQGERADRHVAVLARGGHVAHGEDLRAGQLSGRGMRTGGAVIEHTERASARPLVVARRGNAQQLEDNGEPQMMAGLFDGADQLGLGVTRRESLAIKSDPGHTEKDEEQAYEAQKKADTLLEARHPGLQLRSALIELVEGHHLRRGPSNPGGDGGPRDRQIGWKATSAALSNAVADAMVVLASRAMAARRPGHAGRLAQAGRGCNGEGR